NKLIAIQLRNNVHALIIRAAIYFDLCQYNKALVDINKFLKIKPNETLYRQLLSLFDQLETQNYQNQHLLLEFEGHQIRNTEVTALAKALKSNFSLTSLNFQYNKIVDTGATALARSIESNFLNIACH